MSYLVLPFPLLLFFLLVCFCFLETYMDPLCVESADFAVFQTDKCRVGCVCDGHNSCQSCGVSSSSQVM